MATDNVPCDCDLDFYCGQHIDCPLCGREHDADQSEEPKLCPTCTQTAKAYAKMARHEREWIADGRP
jgi:hypothetical protein